MIVGCLGDIVFKVSASTIRTVSGFTWSGQAQYATHDIVKGNSIIEFTGIKPDEISFDLYLSSSLGVDIIGDCTKIFTYEREGTTLPLVLGEKTYGKYRWCIKSHKVKAKAYDVKGNMTDATVSISLVEYTRG